MQQRCNTEKCKPSAVELKTMFFSEKYFLKVLKSHDPIPLNELDIRGIFGLVLGQTKNFYWF